MLASTVPRCEHTRRRYSSRRRWKSRPQPPPRRKWKTTSCRLSTPRTDTAACSCLLPRPPPLQTPQRHKKTHPLSNRIKMGSCFSLFFSPTPAIYSREDPFTPEPVNSSYSQGYPYQNEPPQQPLRIRIPEHKPRETM